MPANRSWCLRGPVPTEFLRQQAPCGCGEHLHATVVSQEAGGGWGQQQDRPTHLLIQVISLLQAKLAAA